MPKGRGGGAEQREDDCWLLGMVRRGGVWAGGTVTALSHPAGTGAWHPSRGPGRSAVTGL